MSAHASRSHPTYSKRLEMSWWRAAAIALVLLVGAITAAIASRDTAWAVSAKPNIIFIVTDDQRIGTVDELNDPTGGVWMPNVKNYFIDHGTKFTRAFVDTPECCPSRASIFTGRYAHNHGVQSITNHPELGSGNRGAEKLDEDTTLQRYLHDAGYYTGMFGKFMNGWSIGTFDSQPDDPNTPGPATPPKIPKYWDTWGTFNSGYGAYDGCTGTAPTLDGNPCLLHTAEGYKDWQGQDHGVHWNYSIYSTEYVRERALTFLQNRQTGSSLGIDTPWFLYLATYAPHPRAKAETRHATDVVPAYSPHPQSYFEGEPSYNSDPRTDKPPYVRTGKCCSRTIPTNYSDTFPETERTEQLRSLKSVDDMVGAVVQKVRDMGQESNTIIFLVSDNGYLWGEHALEGKATPYTESVQVPMYMRWPSPLNTLPPVDTRLVQNIDLAPTTLATAAVTSPAPNSFCASSDSFYRCNVMDGRSLFDTTSRNHVLTEFWNEPEVPPEKPVPTWSSLIAAPTQNPYYQYTEYEDDPNTTGVVDPFKEYYNLSADLPQLTNLFGSNGSPDPGEPDPSSLSAQLGQDRNCSGHGELTAFGHPPCP